MSVLPKKYLILLASGRGTRFGGDIPKQFVRIRGKMISEYTLRACDVGLFDEIIFVVSGDYVTLADDLVGALNLRTPIRIVVGGGSRLESCQRGLAVIADEKGVVVVHNAAQPFVGAHDFEMCLAALAHYDAVVSAIPCVYTTMRTDGNGLVQEVLDRSRLCCDMGVEGFQLPVLRQAFAKCDTFDHMANIVSIIVKYGLGNVHVFEGNPGNIKITNADDLYVAERILEARSGASNESCAL